MALPSVSSFDVGGVVAGAAPEDGAGTPPARGGRAATSVSRIALTLYLYLAHPRPERVQVWWWERAPGVVL